MKRLVGREIDSPTPEHRAKIEKVIDEKLKAWPRLMRGGRVENRGLYKYAPILVREDEILLEPVWDGSLRRSGDVQEQTLRGFRKPKGRLRGAHGQRPTISNSKPGRINTLSPSCHVGTAVVNVGGSPAVLPRAGGLATDAEIGRDDRDRAATVNPGR